MKSGAPEEFGARLIEDSRAAHACVLRGFPGVEIHDDPDVVWTVQQGSVWGNAAIRIRFSAGDVNRRLDDLTTRFRKHRRGAGFWVSALSTPDDIAQRLRRRRFNCRKHFPGMVCDLSQPGQKYPPPAGIKVYATQDVGSFREHGHPYFGRPTTAIRRFTINTLEQLLKLEAGCATAIVAERDGRPVGTATVFVSGRTAELFDVGVIEPLRRQGIGTAVVTAACDWARSRSCEHAVLIAAEMGESVYRRVGFVEACKMSFYYCAAP